MKSVQRIIFSILTLVVIMSMANPVFAEEQKKVKLYDTEMNLISTFQSETELENYLENMPALHSRSLKKRTRDHIQSNR